MKTLISLLAALAAGGVAADDRAVAVEYLRARCATLTAGATTAEVDRVMAVIADEAVIEHPRFGAVVKGKEAIRRGIVSHLDAYTGDERESGIVVLEEIQSPGAVVFRTKTSFVTGEGPARKVTAREGLTIVEVRDGRISRLIEY